VGVYSYRQHRRIAGHELFQKAYRNYRMVLMARVKPSDKALKQLFKQFDAILSEYPSEPAGERALLYTGHVLYMMKDYKGALERYSRMKSTSLVKAGLGDLILYNMGMTRLAMKDYEAAKDLLGQLSRDGDSPYRRDASATIGGIYEAMGKKKEAVQAYRQYLKMFPKAPDAPYIRARMSALVAPEEKEPEASAGKSAPTETASKESPAGEQASKEEPAKENTSMEKPAEADVAKEQPAKTRPAAEGGAEKEPAEESKE
jgi:tetratricopeptide (TPR) repeat protein